MKQGGCRNEKRMEIRGYKYLFFLSGRKVKLSST